MWYNNLKYVGLKEQSMKICVAGLGLIGGSLCMSLKRAGYKVDGWNRSPKPLKYALENGIIEDFAQNFCGYDIVFVALPPQATLDFINGTAFKDGALVSDICGVKGFIEKAVFSKPRNFSYVGCHPMAGKEVSGIENACAELFDGANMVITHSAHTNPFALQVLRSLTKAMGFGRLIECSAEVHDRKIAYTSQLAHIVSNAYVKDNEIESCFGFTGGSFQDMTRIAGVDEAVWSALYLENAENVSGKIASLITSLSEIKSAVDSGNAEKLRAVLKSGRVLFEESKLYNNSAEITVTVLNGAN